MDQYFANTKTRSALFLFFLSFALCFPISYAKDEGVAQVIVIRGEVKAKLPSGEILDLKKDMWLKEGSVIQSGTGSFARLLFIDKSTMNLGPDSQMVIDQFPENAAGIITLMKGQVRSNVTKDYMNNTDTDKSKLFIKTKTAAMGVRGTDFQVNYNPANNNTALITFSGAVAMAQFDTAIGDRSFSRDMLEKTVSSERAVVVKQGEFSGVTPQTSRATIPTRLNPTQLETLKKNDGADVAKASPADSRERKEFRNPIPPGVDSKTFSNNPTESITKTIQTNLGSSVADTMVRNVANERAAIAVTSNNSAPPPEGFKDNATGAYAPPAGSVIDLATVNIIPIPKGSTFDTASGTFMIPPELGRVNPTTGQYEAPKGMILTNEGSLVKVETTDTATRSPASTNTAGSVTETQPTQVLNITMDSVISSTDNEIKEFDMENYAEERLVENERAIELELEQTVIENTRTNVSFDLTVTP